MNNSPVCTFKRGKEQIPKVKYLTIDEARRVVARLNILPTTIHLFKEYKCTTCHFFHIGKSNKLKVVDPVNIFAAPKPVEVIPQPEPPKNDVPTVTETPVPEVEDDFDWSTNKKIIKKILN